MLQQLLAEWEQGKTRQRTKAGTGRKAEDKHTQSTGRRLKEERLSGRETKGAASLQVLSPHPLGFRLLQQQERHLPGT